MGGITTLCPRVVESLGKGQEKCAKKRSGLVPSSKANRVDCLLQFVRNNVLTRLRWIGRLHRLCTFDGLPFVLNPPSA
jgi:hypothetical protein